MQELFTAFLLGIVEGITEFLPISSTGHLILVNQILDFSDKAFSNMFNVVIQLGAILSIVVLFRKQLIPFYSSQDSKEKSGIWKLWGQTLIAVIPALVLGFLFADFIETYLFNPITVALALIVWGLGLILIEKLKKNTKALTVQELGWKRTLTIGFIQCLAMIPGTSRSAATILGGMLLGAPRKTAAEFSFFLAIPTMAAASGYALLKFILSSIKDGSGGFTLLQIGSLTIGFIVSFVVALLVVRALMKLLSKHSFQAFGWYRLALGAGVLLVYILGGFKGI